MKQGVFQNRSVHGPYNFCTNNLCGEITFLFSWFIFSYVYLFRTHFVSYSRIVALPYDMEPVK